MMTISELKAKKSRILAEYPVLDSYRLPLGCCQGCVETEVREEHGTWAAYAWCELQEVKWLLGEE